MDLVKKLSLMFTVLIWVAEFLIRTQCNELDECCFRYASIPYNDDVCVPDGETVALNCFIINPHDNSTNLTVTWFRGTTKDISRATVIATNSEGHNFTTLISGTALDVLPTHNCSRQLYRDSTFLMIKNFTRDREGYYWCQLVINNKLTQPSHRIRSIQLYAGECNSTDYRYFRSAHSTESQCAKYVNTRAVTTVTFDSYTITSVQETPTRLFSVTQLAKETERSIFIVVGSLGTLVVLFGALVVVLFTHYLCKFWNREKTQHYQMDDTSNTGNIVAAITSSTVTVSAMQPTTSMEDIKGIESSSTTRSDNETSHALPYEVAVFQGQILSDDAQTQLHMTDSKPALQLYDEVNYNKYNQQHRKSQACNQINDEHHMYDEVNHEAKEGQTSIEGNNQEAITALELFDDMVYAKSATNMKFSEDDYFEPTAPKKQKDRPRFDDEHLYDSADHNNMSKGQTPAPTTASVKSNSTKFKGKADGTKQHTYHSLKSPETTSPNDMPNRQSEDYNPTVYNCRFDDPMYESNPHPGADPTAIVSPSSTKAESDVIELQDDKSAICMQGKPLNYSVDAENFADTPQVSDACTSKDNHVIMDSQDKVDRNLASTYDVFDDPTYGVCHAGLNKK